VKVARAAVFLDLGSRVEAERPDAALTKELERLRESFGRPAKRPPGDPPTGSLVDFALTLAEKAAAAGLEKQSIPNLLRGTPFEFMAHSTAYRKANAAIKDGLLTEDLSRTSKLRELHEQRQTAEPDPGT
jgi:hypothetical protein